MDSESIKYDLITNQSIDFDSIFDILKKVFKHDQFRNTYQKDAVNEACRFQKDLFVSLPTGSGKSLIYQLPAVYRNHGLVIVISPLVALMSNQLLNAKKLGIPAVTINSHMTKTWNQEVKNELLKKSCKIRLLYLTPETLCSDHFRFYLTLLNKNRNLKLFAIDEAHCVSSWGHEFRPDYLKLANLRIHCPNIPIIALTATAPPKVLQDIIEVLKLKNPKHIVAPSFRKNLFYDVRPADALEGQKLLQDIYEFIKKCLNIQDKDELSPGLKSNEEFEQLLLGKGRGRKKVIVKESIVRKSNGVNNPNGVGGGVATTSAFVSAASLLNESDNIITKPKLKFLDSVRKTTTSLAVKKQSSSSLKLGGDIKQFLFKATSKVAKKEPSLASNSSSKVVDVIQIDDDDDDDDDDGQEAKPTKTTTTSKSSKNSGVSSNSQFVSAASLMSNEDTINKLRHNTPVVSRKRPHSSTGSNITTPKQNRNLEARRKSLIGAGGNRIQNSGGVGIVYCRTKLNCEDVANFLSRKGIPSRPYHSSLTPKQRSEIEKLWMDEEILIICATISFGMGIDKPNVRVVIHYNMSQSLANYYQESGRAGRDGERAYCRLYYSKSDQNAIVFLLRKNLDLETDGDGDDCDVGGYPAISTTNDSNNKFSRTNHNKNNGNSNCNDNSESAGAANAGSRYDPANWRQLLPKPKVETARNAMDRFRRMVDYCQSKKKCRHYLLAKEFAIRQETSSLINGCKDACDFCVGRPISPESFLENSYYD